MSTKKEIPTATNDVYDHSLEALPAIGVDLDEINRKWQQVQQDLEDNNEERTSQLIEKAVKAFTPKELGFLWVNEQFKTQQENPMAALMEALAGGPQK